MAEIDVLVTFDAQTIVRNYGRNTDPENPVAVSADLIFMVTAQNDALNGNGGGELTVYAHTGDSLRWYEATPSPDYSAILYKFIPTENGELISKPEPFVVPVTVPLPVKDDPTHPKTQTIEEYFWNSLVLNEGHVTYHFWFMVLNRDGEVQGYYWWDPYIKIKT